MNKCPYCKKEAGRIFKGTIAYCSRCDAQLTRHDESTGIDYVKCQHCGFEPVPNKGRLETYCPKCNKMTF